MPQVVDRVGATTGLAWSPNGGEIIPLEVEVRPGNGKVIIPRNGGEVFRQSVRTAADYVLSRAEEFQLPGLRENVDVQVRLRGFFAEVMPLDGPSAGLPIATALVSALTGVPIRQDIAIVGEVTSRGRVLPTRNLKERIFAAYRHGFRRIVLPLENESDMRHVPDVILKHLIVDYVGDLDQVLPKVLVANYRPSAFPRAENRQVHVMRRPPFGHLPRIFLCYARADSARVVGLYRALADAGFHPWIDSEDLLGGQDWKRTIVEAIRNAAVFVACLSHVSTNRRGTVQVEIREALEAWRERLDSDLYLVPVRLDDCEVPSELARFQWVDLYAPTGLAKLTQGLAKALERLGYDAPKSVGDRV